MRLYTIRTVRRKIISDDLGLIFSIDDMHIATLTVAQTLAFVLSTKTPSSKGCRTRISGQDIDIQSQEALLGMLNMSHVSGTLVGDEFVRGVSGGERKRVSIAEMMSTGAPVQCWDNPTRGLDASTAFDCIRSLRVMTDVLRQTTFVTLYVKVECDFPETWSLINESRYQASEGIYDLFDRVLVLDEGRQIYLGPPTLARSYFEELGFESLPRQPTVDYLTACTDPNERKFCRGRGVADVPSSPEALEQAFWESGLGFDLRRELEHYKESMKDNQEMFEGSVLVENNSRASKKSPYTLGYAGQVMALARRQFQMRLQDRFQLVTSFSLSVVRKLTKRLISSDQLSDPCHYHRSCIFRPAIDIERRIYSHQRHFPQHTNVLPRCIW